MLTLRSKRSGSPIHAPWLETAATRGSISRSSSVAISSELMSGGDYKNPTPVDPTAAYRTPMEGRWLDENPTPRLPLFGRLRRRPPRHGSPSARTARTSPPTTARTGGLLRPDPARHEASDADRNWNAISLPFVVGPHGRIGKLNAAAVGGNPGSQNRDLGTQS